MRFTERLSGAGCATGCFATYKLIRTRTTYGKDTTINALLAVRNPGNFRQKTTSFSQIWPPAFRINLVFLTPVADRYRL
jgi:hypothetical protein